MNKKAQLSIGGIVLALLVSLLGPELLGEPADGGSSAARPGAELAGAAAPRPTGAGRETPADRTRIEHPDIGFRSRSAFDDHFEKHAHEFGDITQVEYLRLAQELRDRAVGDGVLEVRRADGVSSRFDEQSGAFVAFDEDLTLRTFFKPNDGLRYFERQARKDH